MGISSVGASGPSYNLTSGSSDSNGASGLPGPVQWTVHQIGRVLGPILDWNLGRQRDPAIIASARDDGDFVGAAGILAPSTNPETIAPISPDAAHRRPSRWGTLIYVNGIGTPIQRVIDNDLKAVANATGHDVVGIYRADRGIANDFAEVAGDWAGAGDDPASNTLAKVIIQRLTANQPMHIMCDSGGGSTTSRGIRMAEEQLSAQGMSPDEINQRLKKLTVYTLGVAERLWPDGPNYYHYVNRNDPTARFFGPVAMFSQPGQGAHLLEFSSGPLSNPVQWDHNHSFDVYFPWIEADFAQIDPAPPAQG